MSRPEQSGGRVTATDVKMTARGRLSPTKEVTGGQAGHHGAGERSVRVFLRSRSRLRISPRTGASERSEVAPGAGKGLKKPEHQTEAAERSVRVFMRSRSRPQRPRTGSPNAVRSAGTGQKGSTKCRRGGPVAAQRSSGRPRRQDREPHWGGRAREAMRPEGRSAARPRRTTAPAREGGGKRCGRRCTKPEGSDAAARPRRLQRSPPTEQISETSALHKTNGDAQDLRPGTKTPREDQQGRCRTWGRGKGRRRPCPSAEGKDAGGVTGLEQRNALARRLPTA